MKWFKKKKVQERTSWTHHPYCKAWNLFSDNTCNCEAIKKDLAMTEEFNIPHNYDPLCKCGVCLAIGNLKEDLSDRPHHANCIYGLTDASCTCAEIQAKEREEALQSAWNNGEMSVRYSNHLGNFPTEFKMHDHVKVWFDNGAFSTGPVASFRWKHLEGNINIVEYAPIPSIGVRKDMKPGGVFFMAEDGLKHLDGDKVTVVSSPLTPFGEERRVQLQRFAEGDRVQYMGTEPFYDGQGANIVKIRNVSADIIFDDKSRLNCVTSDDLRHMEPCACCPALKKEPVDQQESEPAYRKRMGFDSPLTPAENIARNTDNKFFETANFKGEDAIYNGAGAIGPGEGTYAGYKMLSNYTQSGEADSSSFLGDVCSEARNSVLTKQGTYGSPRNNFENIAALWNVVFKNKLAFDGEFTATDIATAMRLVKEARLMQTPDHKDSLVDIAGYADCHNEIVQQDAEMRGGVAARDDQLDARIATMHEDYAAKVAADLMQREEAENKARTRQAVLNRGSDSPHYNAAMINSLNSQRYTTNDK